MFFLNKDNKIIHANQEALKVCPNLRSGFPILGYQQDIMKNFSPYVLDPKLEGDSSFQSE